MTRTGRSHFRTFSFSVNRSDFDVIRMAAYMTGKSVSEFVRDAAADCAARELEDLGLRETPE